MSPTYTYACNDYPGMEQCPGCFCAASEVELWKLMELHASTAHGEDPGLWTEDEKAHLRSMIRTELKEIAQAVSV